MSILVGLSLPSAAGEVGFKFGIMPEEAFDLLITAASKMRGSGPFRFEDEVRGSAAANDESFDGTLGRKFVDLFADFPAAAASELAELWSAEIGRVMEMRFPRKPRQRTMGNRLGSAIVRVICAAILYPLIAVNMLRPSVRRERAENRKKWQEGVAERKAREEEDNTLIPRLIELCQTAKARGEAVRYRWYI